MSHRVQVIAVTKLVSAPEGYIPHESDRPTDADELVEIAGRMCYESWDRPNPVTATNQGYVKNILDQQHLSVLEHGCVTIHFHGVTRNFSHELIRHRHFSYSEFSQRYVDAKDLPFIWHPGLDGLHTGEVRRIDKLVEQAKDLYGVINDELVRSGMTRKQARQAARHVLPSGIETKIMVTGNHRAWRELISKRIGPHVDEEFRQVTRAILKELFMVAPSIYADLANIHLLGV